MTPDKPIDDGLTGFTIIPEKGECIKTSSKSKSSEIESYRVVESNMALAKYQKLYRQKNVWWQLLPCP